MRVLTATAAPALAPSRTAPPPARAAGAVDAFSPSPPALGLVPPPQPSFAQRVANVHPVLIPGEPRDVSPGYQQAAPAWNDPEGDAHLTRMMDRLPERLLRSLFRRVTTGEKWDQRHGAVRPPHRVGDRPPIDVEALGRDFESVVQKTGIPPTVGPEHEWSSEAKSYRHFGFWRRVGNWMKGAQDCPSPQFGFSKLLLMLACGYSSRFAVTGQEAALEAALMRYPDRGVKPVDLLRESYILNGGNLYTTLLTAENVLAHDPFDRKRDQQPLQKKLEYLRDDTPQVGDNFAAWYHFFGAALYSLMRPEWLGQGVARVESLGSVLLEGADRQEALVNNAGAGFGSLLRRRSSTTP